MVSNPDPESDRSFQHISAGDADAYPILGAPSGPRADYGPAGSLRQQLARHQALRARSWRPRFFDATSGRLRRKIRAELKASQVLAELVGEGWSILPDRLLPATGHRVPFLLVGPAGVAVISIIEDRKPLYFHEGDLYSGYHNLSLWISTREWEMARTIQGLDDLGAGDVPVWLLALHDPDSNLLRPKIPTPVGSVGSYLSIRDVDQASIWVRDHASALSREYVAMLGGNVAAAFPPAAAKGEQLHGKP